jgi:hypothetical protein
VPSSAVSAATLRRDAPRTQEQRMQPSTRRSGGPLGDGRGLTAAGGAVLLTAAAALGVVIDLASGSGLRAAFAVLFVGSSFLVAARVHREDLLAAIVMPPLVYAVMAVIAAYAQPPGGGIEHGLRQRAIDIGTTLVLTAPVLLVGTALAVFIALRRGRQYARRRQ